jgi:hypothetical protein
MNYTININRNLIRFGIPLCLLGILIFIMKSPFHDENGMALPTSFLLMDTQEEGKKLLYKK